MNSPASRDAALLMLRKALLLARGVPGFARLVNPIRRRYARKSRLVTVTDFDGDLTLRLALEERMQSQIFWYGYCNRDICAVLRRLLKPGMTVVDAGANIGEVTLVAAKAVGPEGRVFSFEPIQRIADHLDQHVQLNRLAQIRVVRCALADKADRKPIFKAAARFYDGSIHDGLGTLYSTAERSIASEEVLLNTLDAFVGEAEVRRVDLVKIDVEGAELAVLRGSAATLTRFKPHLIIEVQEDTARAAGYRAVDILSFLKPMGYGFHVIGRNGRLRPVDESSLGRFQNVLCSPRVRAANGSEQRQ
jgi:FkbM family methyltransferase